MATVLLIPVEAFLFNLLLTANFRTKSFWKSNYEWNSGAESDSHMWRWEWILVRLKKCTCVSEQAAFPDESRWGFRTARLLPACHWLCWCKCQYLCAECSAEKPCKYTAHLSVLLLDPGWRLIYLQCWFLFLSYDEVRRDLPPTLNCNSKPRSHDREMNSRVYFSIEKKKDKLSEKGLWLW